MQQQVCRTEEKCGLPDVQALLEESANIFGLLVHGGLRSDDSAVLLVHCGILYDLHAKAASQCLTMHDTPCRPACALSQRHVGIAWLLHRLAQDE